MISWHADARFGTDPHLNQKIVVSSCRLMSLRISKQMALLLKYFWRLGSKSLLGPASATI